MTLEMSERSQEMIAIYLHDLYTWMTMPSTQDNRERAYQSAVNALTALLVENGVATGYSETMQDIHTEVMQ